MIIVQRGRSSVVRYRYFRYHFTVLYRIALPYRVILYFLFSFVYRRIYLGNLAYLVIQNVKMY